MTFHGQSATHNNRRPRMNLPSEDREARKAPRSNMIRMCDGTEISHRQYELLRSTAHQKFRGTHRGCAQRIREAIPERQWDVIIEWIEENRDRFVGGKAAQEDGLVALLIGHSARTRQQNTHCLYDEIVEKRTAHMLLPAT